MSRTRPFLLAGAILLLLLTAVAGGIWWYLFGGNSVAAAELVPADTLAFATIPNGASVAAGYQTSQLKTLVDSPDSKPVFDWAQGIMGQKVLDLLTAFAPNLSGQSFIAVTHFDPEHPEQVGLIAALKPKPGFGNFDVFLNQLKATWPRTFSQGTTGTGTVAGVNYRWAQGPGAQDKICVAQVGGWTITAWGEASLQDWIERYHGKSATPSLAQNADYEKSLPRLGPEPMTLVYANTGNLVRAFAARLSHDHPDAAASLEKSIALLGPLAVGTRFENGEIVDRASLLVSPQARSDAGFNATQCPFETLKFTGPDTRLYWAGGIDAQQYFKSHLPEGTPPDPGQASTGAWVDALHSWAQDAGLDFQHSLIDPLGSEISVQGEWSADSTYPEAGLFIKLDKPDDFAPTIKAIINSVRAKYATTAVVNELESGGHKFATLKFIQSAAFSPTITEDGDYLGVFLTANQAVRSFQRDPSIGLTHNPDYTRQLSNRRDGASQMIFLDSPRLLDRAYQSVSPYLSLAAMFNRDLAKLLQGHDLPQDLTWLAPMGTWVVTSTPDTDGMKIYSASGVGNQGILVGGAVGATLSTLQRFGFLPKVRTFFPGPTKTSASPLQTAPASPVPPVVMPTSPPDAPPVLTNSAPATPETPTPAPPDAATNSSPSANPPADANSSAPR